MVYDQQPIRLRLCVEVFDGKDVLATKLTLQETNILINRGQTNNAIGTAIVTARDMIERALATAEAVCPPPPKEVDLTE